MIIFIEKLTTTAMIGIYDWEQKNLQKLIFDLQIKYCKNEFTFKKNELYYLDYKEISNTILSLVDGKNFRLLEEIAEIILKNLKKRFKVSWIKIKISKPSSIPQAENVGIIFEKKINI